MDDFELINRVLSGEKRAWNFFVEKYANLIYSAIICTFHQYGRKAGPETLADLYQDVFVKLIKDNCKALRAFQGRNKCKLSTYLREIAKNTTIDYLRRPKTEDPDDDHNLPADHKTREFISELSDESVKDLIKKLDAKIIIQRLMDGLPDKRKKLCQLYYFEEMEPKEVAKELEISVDIFYSEKSRTLKNLNQLYIKEKKF